MKKRILLIVIFSIFSVQVFADNDSALVERLKSHLTYLASDKLEGRGPGTAGIDLAAAYIERIFKQNRLQPGGDNGTYFQKINIKIGVTLGDKNRLKIGKKSFKVNESFIPLGVSDNVKVEGPLVFAGFGIIANEYNYNDFEGLDIHGKIALILTNEPGERDSTSIFDGKDVTIHSEIRSKVINAKTNGAIGVILVNGPKYHPKDKPLLKLRVDTGYHNIGIPVVQVTQHAIQSTLGKGILEQLQTMIELTEKPHSRAFDNISVQITTDLKEIETAIKNVIAVYPGDGTKFRQSPVILGAHYDHLGYGGPASRAPGVHEIHNGADDNASGVSALLEIANTIASFQKELKRPLVFIAFSGEEIGMIGSTYYVNHPIFRLDSTIAMINMDEIGRMVDNKLIIFGVNSAEEWNRIVTGSNQKHQFELTLPEDGFSPSDHAIFNAKNIPVLHFYTGDNEDYHKPSDDVEKINFPALARITNMVTDICEYLANRDKPLTYSKGGNVIHGKTISESDSTASPWLGTIPDFSYQKGDGLRLGGVSSGSPAEMSGLKEGDLIIKIDNVTINSIYELHHLLARHKAGDAITITFIRWGLRRVVQVILAARD